VGRPDFIRPPYGNSVIFASYFCNRTLEQTLERLWIHVQSVSGTSRARLVLRPRQEQLLHLLRDHSSLSPAEIWKALSISRQGAMDLLRPLLDAGIDVKVGERKTGQCQLKTP
jgi:predicted HTH transcriptional regulator